MAIGCIGMSLDDFCRCYCEEFEAICHAWSDMREGENRDNWERMRMLASITISPHVKKPIPPKKLIPLPWDKENPEKPERDDLTIEQRRARAEEMLRRIEGIPQP